MSVEIRPPQPGQAGGGLSMPAGPAREAERLSVRTGWRDEEWDALLASKPEATFFHTRAWTRLLLGCFPALRDRSLWLESPEGPVLLPLHAWRRAGGLLTTVQSAFPFLYGGPVPARGQDGQERLPDLLSAVGAVRDPLVSVRIASNPFSLPDPVVVGTSGDRPVESASDRPAESASDRPAEIAVDQPAESPGGRGAAGLKLRTDTTHRMVLPATEEEYWERGLTTAKRNDVRRLGKKGVTVEETREEAAIDTIYGFYVASFERWGGRPGMVYPHAFYRALLREGGDAVRLTVARHEGKLIGGTFTVRWNGTVHYLAGYFDHESRALRPNVLIQVESILRAIRDGFRRYDFLPSGGHEAVETFKESFGGIRTPYPVWERKGWAHRILRRG